MAAVRKERGATQKEIQKSTLDLAGIPTLSHRADANIIQANIKEMILDLFTLISRLLLFVSAFAVGYGVGEWLFKKYFK